MTASKAFAAVDTLPKTDKKSLNPRATRYGFLPIWGQPTNSRDFYVWEIPANTVFPFRPFIGEVGQDVNGNETYRTERLPLEQVIDLQRMNRMFVELEPLARLESEEAAARVAEILVNPHPCTKYEMEVGTDCATCWLKYLFSEAADKVKAIEDATERKAARECVAILTQAMSNALEEARRQTDEAIRMIDDPKSGKLAFTAKDYLNVYNTHAERPQYKTSTSNTNSIDQLVGALTGALKKDDAPAPSQVDIDAIVAQAVAKALADERLKTMAAENDAKAAELLAKQEDKKKKTKED